MDTCIAIIIYCQRLFLLFTGLNFLGGIYLQPISVFMQNFKFGGVTVLAVQLFNKTKPKKKGEEELERTCFAVFPTCYVKIHLFLVNIFIFLCFRH